LNSLLRLAAAAIAVATGACATTTVRTDVQQIPIATEAYLVLPGSEDLTESFDATQVIAARYLDDSYSFEAHIEARPGSITIVGIGALGGALFSISYDGAEISATGAQEAQVINAEYVLADVLLTHWDPDWLNRRLRGAAVTLAEDGKKREVTRGGEPIISIAFDTPDPWSGSATLNHHERQYELHISTAEFVRR